MWNRLSGAMLLMGLLVLVPRGAQAAITHTLVSEGAFTSSSGPVFPSVGISPAANTLILISYVNRFTTGVPNTPTLSGCGMTWVQVVTGLTADNTTRMTVFRAMSATPGSSCQLTPSFGGQAQVTTSWVIYQLAGVDTSGIDGSGAIVQAPATDNEGNVNVLSAAVTLASFADAANNAAIGFFFHGASGAATPGSGFTLSGDVLISSRRHNGEWRIGQDTSVDMSWASTGRVIGAALEIKASTDPAPNECLGLPVIVGIGC